jgi:hypothetical protein
MADPAVFEADNLVLAVLIVFLVDHEGTLEVIRRWVRDEAGGSVGTALDGAADGGEDGIGAEEVDTAVDQVGDVALGLLDVVQNTARVRIGDNAAEVGGSILADPCAQNNSLGILLLGELKHLVEREAAADVGVQYKDALGAALEDRIAEVVEATCGAESLVFAEVFDRQVREFGR